MRFTLLFPSLLLALSPAFAAEPFHYQLQNPNPAALARTGIRTVVIDYSRDGTDATRHSPAAIRRLNRAVPTTLAYFSIGEAENYRFYWQPDWVRRKNSNTLTASAPAWLGRTNPDWLGNYKVRYWDPPWRDQILAPYLDRIIRQGFDGVYLDIIDAWEYWASPASYGSTPARETFQPNDPRGNPREAARRMIDLVRWIKQYGQQKSGGPFLVVPQNGENILQHDSANRYLRTIDGIGVEDLFYNETRPQPARETAYRLRFLRQFRAANRFILCVDYVDNGRASDPQNQSRIADFIARCQAEGFDYYPARSDRELDQLP